MSRDTIGARAMVLPNGRLFHERWQATIRAQHPRARRTWWRVLSAQSVPQLVKRGTKLGWRKARRLVTSAVQANRQR